MLMQNRVKEAFDYKDGKLFWNIRKKSIQIGDRVGGIHKHTGYRRLQLDKKTYLEHRIIFLFHHGYLPKEIDHINRIKTDNRIQNLRECTRNQNHMNLNKQKTNCGKGCSSKYKGVSWNKNAKKWSSIIKTNYKSIYLGYFDLEKDAAEAYNRKAIELFGKFAHVNEVK